MANSILAKMAVEISANTAQFNKSIAETNRKLDSFSKGVTGIGKTLIAGFGLYEIGRGIIDVTSQFQKFEAILTNTLGDSSAAQKALRDIEAFAQNTPFQVDEVTAAYVRWANQGLDPTIDRMGKLGDIASSLGAGFEQTAEAFKDLMVGQTKRIEEIGISATQANGKIQLSFKDVNIEVEKNKEGVQKALEVYSQLNGVLGTSDAVSKTLGGRISNLKDSWDQLLKTLGEGNSGVLFTTVTLMTRLIQGLNYAGVQARIFTQGVKGLSDLDFEKLMNFGETESLKSIATVLKDITSQSNADFFKNISGNMKEFVSLLVKEGETQENALDTWSRYVDVRIKSTQLDRDNSKKEAIKDIKDEIKAAKECLEIAQKEAALKLKKALEAKKAAFDSEDSRFGRIAKLDRSQTGKKDTNILGFNVQPEVNTEGIISMAAAYDGLTKSITAANVAQDATNNKTIESRKIFAQYAYEIGNSVAGAIQGQLDFAQAFAKVTASVLDSIQQRIIANIAEGTSKAFAKNPILGIAVATAGFALAKGLLSRVANAKNSSNQQGIASSVTASTYNANSGLSTVIRGQDLYVVMNNYSKSKGFTTGG